MLVFSTKLPLLPTTTESQCINLFLRWIVGSEHYPFTEKDFLYYNPAKQPELELQRNGCTFSVTTYQDDTVSLSGCLLVKQLPQERWETQNVFIEENGEKYICIQTHCIRSDFRAEPEHVKPPYTVKLFLQSGLCDRDCELPISAAPIPMTEALLPICARLMTGTESSLLPMVYISSSVNPSPVSPNKLAAALQGVAHVLLEPDTVFTPKIRAAANGHNVYNGYIGVYFPGMDYHRSFSCKNYASAEAMYMDIRHTIWAALLNKLDTAQYSWNHIRALQNRQRFRSLERETADLEEMRKWFDAVDPELKRLEVEVKEKAAECTRLYTENERLHSELDAYRESGMNSGVSLLAGNKEHDLYPDERRDIVLDCLQQKLDRCLRNSRPYDVLTDILNANQPSGRADEIVKVVRRVLKSNDGSIISDKAKNELKAAGFSIDGSGAHYKLQFGGDARYTFTVAKTPSDHRGTQNAISQFLKQLFLRG